MQKVTHALLYCREEKGVKVRLEVGPKDAEQSKCIIARSQAVAGQVAYKEGGDIGATLPDAVRKLLAMKDKDVPKGDDAKYEKERAKRAEAEAQASGNATDAAQGTGKAESKAASAREQGGGKRDARHTVAEDLSDGDGDGPDDVRAEGETTFTGAEMQNGDALDDDFRGEVELEDVRSALTEAEKKRLRKRAKSGLLRHKVIEREDAVSDTAPVKKKQLKTVKF